MKHVLRTYIVVSIASILGCFCISPNHMICRAKDAVSLRSKQKAAIERIPGNKVKALIAVAQDLKDKEVDIGDFDFYVRDVGNNFEVHPAKYDRKLKVYAPGGYVYSVSKKWSKIMQRVRENEYSPPPGYE